MHIRPLLLTALIFLPGIVGANAMPQLPSDTVPFIQPLAADGFGASLPMPEDPTQAAADTLTAIAPHLDAGVALRAQEAALCAQDDGLTVEKLIVVDMSAGANEKRLWAFDLKDPTHPRLVINARVAHGSGSDPDADGQAQRFSNVPNSNATSLGLYRIAERYQGKNGWSRRLDGLFARFNSNARERSVVLHPSSYVNPGHVGRSHGCPAVNQNTMDALEQAGLTNAFLWIDGPDKALEQAVADCSKHRREALVAQARTKQLNQLMARWIPGVARVSLMPWWDQEDLSPVGRGEPGLAGSDTSESAPMETRMLCFQTQTQCRPGIDMMPIGFTVGT